MWVYLVRDGLSIQGLFETMQIAKDFRERVGGPEWVILPLKPLDRRGMEEVVKVWQE